MPIPFLPEHVYGRPAMLLLLLLLPLLLLLRGRAGRSPAVVFGSLPFLDGVVKPVRSRFGLPTSALATFLALACGILALAQPQKQNSKEQFTASGVEIYLAIDVSDSMKILDFQLAGKRLNRLSAAKYVISEFVEARPNDRIGLMIFSGQPSALGPLTLDHDWVQNTIARDIHFRHKTLTRGTRIGTAISASAYRLANRDSVTKAKSQVIVLLTDGAQDGAGLSPQDAAGMAATLGIKVYPIAIGTPGQHRIPGNPIPLTQSFDFETLQEVAAITGTQAYLANNTESLRSVFAEIDELEKTEIDSRTTVETTELYQWCLAAGLFCLILGLAFEHSLLIFAP
ncbi:MAG: Ca-activated chloride channel family protein [Pseudoalteromonas tetraodonis]|jgi:Ca-activated chloride channel family protein